MDLETVPITIIREILYEMITVGHTVLIDD